MNLQISDNKRYSNFLLHRKLSYVLRDTIGITVFFIMLIKCILFMNVLSTDGASKLTLNFHYPLLGDFYIYFLVTLAFISFSFLFSSRKHIISLFILNLIYTVLLVGDLWYYRGFKDFLSLHLLSQTQNLNNLFSGVLSMSRPIDLIFILDNIFVLYLIIKFKDKYKTLKKEKWIFPLLFLPTISIILILHFIYDDKGSNYNGPVLFKTEFIASSTMKNLSPIGYHIFDSILYVQDHAPYNLSSEEKENIQKWLDYKNENLSPNEYSGKLQGKNLIIIQVESLENFVINQNYNGQVLTPNLNKLLSNSLYFPNFYEQVNNGTSSDSDLLINTSVFPVRRGSTFFRFPANKYNTLATLFKSKNYYTRALHSDYGYYWNLMNAISNFNFDQCWDITKLDSSNKENVFGLGLTDKSFFNQVSQLIPKDPKPFFYFTVTTTTHGPFDLREDMKYLDLPEDFDKTKMGGYFQSARYVDEQIGNFLKKLEEEKVLDNTVVVIYGDHNGVHKYYNDEIDKLEQKEPWWDNYHKLPLIIYDKSLEGKEIQTVGGQIDVLPTLAYLFGIDDAQYKNTSLGRNLLNTNKNYALLNDGEIIGEDNLTAEDINHIKQSFDISDLIIRTNYFNPAK